MYLQVAEFSHREVQAVRAKELKIEGKELLYEMEMAGP